MRRILVLLFLTLTALQLAFAGLPVAAAVVQVADHVVSHHGDAGEVQESPCDTLDTHQACTVCGACQLCHQAAQPDVQVLAMAPRAANLVFPPPNTRYLSAEHAPSLKPPIR